MLKSIVKLVAVLLLSPGMAVSVESLVLPQNLAALEVRGSWSDTLDELESQGIPSYWKLLGPTTSTDGKPFLKPTDPELTDDWSLPITDKLGRLLKVNHWNKPKDDDSGYVDFYELLPSIVHGTVFYAGTVVEAPVDGPGILWFEGAGTALVYCNGELVLTAFGKKSKYEGQNSTLIPVAIALKKGRNFIKLKLLKAHSQVLKGMGFFTRIERNDLEWHKLLLAKLKEFYPAEDAGFAGADQRLTVARLLEKSGATDQAAALNKEIFDNYPTLKSIREEASDALARLKGSSQTTENAAAAWNIALAQFQQALAVARTETADKVLREYLGRHPFSEGAGPAFCYRGALRLDYGCDESALPYYERALREFSDNETVRRLGLKGAEYAKFSKPERSRAETSADVEIALAALQRSLHSADRTEFAAGMKAFAALVMEQPAALVRAGGIPLFPRFVSLNFMAREFMRGLSAEQKHLFAAPLARTGEAQMKALFDCYETKALANIAINFPGTAAGARALNRASNLLLDRGEYDQALTFIKALLDEYSGSGWIDENLIKAKQAHVLKKAAQGESAKSYSTFGANNQRTGYAEKAVVPTKLAQKWTVPLALSEYSRLALRSKSEWQLDNAQTWLESFPVVANGKAYSATRQDLVAIDMNSGGILWKQEWNNSGYVLSDRFAGYPRSMPTVKNDHVFIRAVVSDKRSVLRAYNANTGALEWDSGGLAGVQKYYFSSEPLAANKQVYALFFEVGEQEIIRYGMAALDESNGALLWTRYFGSGDSGIAVLEKYHEGKFASYWYRLTMQLGPPAVADGVIYTETGLGSLAALDAWTGTILWLAEYPRVRMGSQQGSISGLEGFLPRLQKVIARGPSSPIVGSAVIALAPLDAAGVMAFERSTGQLRWSRELLDARFFPGICEDKLVVADNAVLALDINTGIDLWQYAPIGVKAYGHPLLSGGELLMPCEDSMHRIDVRSGKLLEKLTWDTRTGPLGNLVPAGAMLLGINAAGATAVGE